MAGGHTIVCCLLTSVSPLNQVLKVWNCLEAPFVRHMHYIISFQIFKTGHGHILADDANLKHVNSHAVSLQLYGDTVHSAFQGEWSVKYCSQMS